MAHLFGRTWTRDELLASVGRMEQVAGIRTVRLEGGKAQDVRAFDVNCGDGLRFTVLPDLCMDIPHLEYRGVPLTWYSRNGVVGPQFYEPWSSEWLRSFFGGLVTTCGLTQVGQPCDDDGEHLPLHGRIGNTPAEDVAAETFWDGNEYGMRMTGTVRESRVFRDDLTLRREITTWAGSRTVRLSDTVRNDGNKTSPFMLLYHCNTGFPLLGPDARLLSSDISVEPKDERSRQYLPEYRRYRAPQPEWEELNYWHDIRPDAKGWCQVALVNEALELPFGQGIGLAIRWRKDQLWNLVQWKQLAYGDYVAALEPANCHTLGRCKERELGTLEHIEPGEVRRFEVEFSVLVGQAEITACEAALPQ